MMTIIVGNKTDSGICRVLTTADNADDPKYVEFPLHTEATPLQPGKPSWANYMKGVLVHFKGNFNHIF